MYFDENYPDWRIGDDRPVPLKPSLPSPGNLALSLSLGEKLGRGSSGLIYEAFVDEANSSSELASSLPPLVVKITYRGRSIRAAHEAYYYETLQPLQGVSIPRYYGRFTADVPPSISPLRCNNVDGARTEETIDIRPGMRPYPFTDEEDTLDPSPNSVGILVLERLGGYLPMNVPLSDALK